MRINRVSRSAALLLCSSQVVGDDALTASAGYEWMTRLAGEWKLAAVDQQEGKTTQHRLIALVEVDGGLYRAARAVKVTAGGCGG